MKRLLCLWLPDWPIQRRRIATKTPTESTQTGPTPAGPTPTAESAKTPNSPPALQGNPSRPIDPPVILWHADPRRGRVVAAACPRALNAGVRLGMPIAQAADLAAMTDAVLEPYDRDADRAALQSLAVELQTHLSPQAAVETLERFKWVGRFRHDPESILLEIQGVTHLFEEKRSAAPDPPEHPGRGGELGVLSAAAAILTRQNLRGRFAIADTIGAAWALANHAAAGRNAGGNSMGDKHHFFVAPPGRTTDALQTLPCAGLRLHPDVVATLDRLGVGTIGSLLRLPREGLATRLGPALCQRIAQATGEVEESLVAIAPQCEHHAILDLEYPTDAMDLLSDRMARLIGRSTKELHHLRRGVLRLQCQLDFTQHPSVVLDTGLFAPTLDQEHLTGLMLGALESVRFGSKVTRMTVGVTQHAPLSSRQKSIFGPDFSSGSNDDWTSQTETARLIDALAGRLGEDAVRGVRVSNDPLPENAIVDYPMTSHRMKAEARKAKQRSRRSQSASKRSARQRAADDSMRWDIAQPSQNTKSKPGFGHGPRTTDLGRRPIELHDQPVAITPLSDSPSGRHEADEPAATLGPGGHFPNRFRIRGRVERVRQHWGPERIETRWWSGPLIRRDYFRIELENGARLWIYYDLGDGTTKQSDTPVDPTNEDEKRWFLHGRFA